MAKKLRMFVTVHERDGDGNPTGRSGTFGPDDSLPGWAQAGITNPDVWADSVPAASDPAGSSPADAPGPDAGAGDGPPPKGGPGSDAGAWREYATRKGVEVPADAKRPAIIAALESAGVPTE